MFEKKVKEEKIHDLNLQPRTCSIVTYEKVLTVCSAPRHVGIGTLVGPAQVLRVLKVVTLKAWIISWCRFVTVWGCIASVIAT